MKIYNCLYLLSILIAFIGTFYLAKGVLWLTPKFIHNMGRTFFGSNPFIKQSFIKQKTDYLLGIVFIFISLILQLILPFTNQNQDAWDFRTCLLFISTILLFMILLSILTWKIIYKKTNKRVNIELARKNLEEFLEQSSKTEKGLREMIKRDSKHISFMYSEEEEIRNLLYKYSKYLKISIEDKIELV